MQKKKYFKNRKKLKTKNEKIFNKYKKSLKYEREKNFRIKETVSNLNRENKIINSKINSDINKIENFSLTDEYFQDMNYFKYQCNCSL